MHSGEHIGPPKFSLVSEETTEEKVADTRGVSATIALELVAEEAR